VSALHETAIASCAPTEIDLELSEELVRDRQIGIEIERTPNAASA
jgi:hypothetical protein